MIKYTMYAAIGHVLGRESKLPGGWGIGPGCEIFGKQDGQAWT